MSTEYSPEDQKRIQRAALLEKFETVKKINLKAAMLCVALGYAGAHRFYLGQRNFGAAIFVAFLSVVALVVLYNFEMVRENVAIIGGVALMLFWIIEILRVSKETDKVNDTIRTSLEDEFYA